MDLQQAYDLLNFWIDKFTGAYYSPEQLDLLTDRGQMSLFDDYLPKYGTSDDINESLSPFKIKYDFTNVTSPNGKVQLPITAPNEFYSSLDVQTQVMTADGRIEYKGLQLPNEDERASMLMSQINPVSSEPFAEWIGKGSIQLYPKVPQAGTVTYLRRPVAPHFVYTVISGRVPVYDPINSIQIEWLEKDHNAILIKALESISINISEQDIIQWSEMKAQQNFQGINRT